MEKSKVYFANFRATVQENIQQKLARLMKTAGMDTIDFDKKYVAIKIHFGEPGNLAYLRPNYAKTVVDSVKSMGGKPFLTDSTRFMSVDVRMLSIIWTALMLMDFHHFQPDVTSLLPMD